jgi:hypothetical protein
MNTLFFVSEKNENCHISKYIISARFAKRWKRGKNKSRFYSVLPSLPTPPHTPHSPIEAGKKGRRKQKNKGEKERKKKRKWAQRETGAIPTLQTE